MKFKKNMIVVLGLLLGMLLSACGSNNADSDSDANGSGELSVYTAFPEDEVEQYIDDFEKETGINVKMVRLSAGETLARLKSEKSNPQAAVWFGGPSDTFVQGSSEGVLEEYQPDEVDEIPEEFLDEEETWTPIYVGALGFASNEDWLEDKGIDAPESWDDLLKPEFKDQISMAHPSSSGTAYTAYATLVQLLGEDDSIDYMKDLDNNMKRYTKSGSAPAQDAGLGETGVGIAFSHDILAAKDEGYPIELSFPEEGTGYEVGAVGLIKDGPEDQQENAKEFIDWSISKEAQDLYADSGAFRLPVNPDADVAEGAVELTDVETIDYDAEWAGDNRESLLDKFDDEVRGEDAAED